MLTPAADLETPDGVTMTLEPWDDETVSPGNWGFNDIGLIAQDGEEQNKTYNLTMYGELPAGTYRLVAYGLTVETTIT